VKIGALGRRFTVIDGKVRRMGDQQAPSENVVRDARIDRRRRGKMAVEGRAIGCRPSAGIMPPVLDVGFRSSNRIPASGTRNRNGARRLRQHEIPWGTTSLPMPSPAMDRDFLKEFSSKRKSAFRGACLAQTTYQSESIS